MKVQKGDWSKLTGYLNSLKCGGKSKPKKFVLTEENLRDITGSVQKDKFYKDHTTQKDIKDRAKVAGFNVEQEDNGDFVFMPIET